jgi:uncharacterized protein YndB with AHSA1/START domain
MPVEVPQYCEGMMMADNPYPTTGASSHELVMERNFDAPRDLVFRAWTDPEHVALWWGPKHFTNPVCEVDARPGGKITIHMQGPDGQIYPMSGIFDEVAEPERLVLTAGAVDDAEGEPQLVVRTTVTFEDVDGRTKLSMHAVIIEATAAAQEALAGMEEGWSQSFERLEEYLTGVLT